MILPEFKTPLEVIVELRDPYDKLWKIAGEDARAFDEEGNQTNAIVFTHDTKPGWYEVIMWPGETLARAMGRGTAQLWYSVGPGTGKTLAEVVKVAPDLLETGAKEVTRTVKTVLWAGGVYLLGKSQKWW